MSCKAFNHLQNISIEWQAILMLLDYKQDRFKEITKPKRLWVINSLNVFTPLSLTSLLRWELKILSILSILKVITSKLIMRSFFPEINYFNCLFCFRLYDVLHSDKKLTLVFEYCDQDLKKYFDSCNGEIDQDVVKVLFCLLFPVWRFPLCQMIDLNL